ncbi:hypothetical protein FACS1894133_0030 [Clostridia bacterium]|nr:hypothetical protein FACS1894133_0030 [Clostridia bacterium]
MKDLSLEQILLEIEKMKQNGEIPARIPDGLFVAEVGGELMKSRTDVVMSVSERDASRERELVMASSPRVSGGVRDVRDIRDVRGVREFPDTRTIPANLWDTAPAERELTSQPVFGGVNNTGELSGTVMPPDVTSALSVVDTAQLLAAVGNTIALSADERDEYARRDAVKSDSATSAHAPTSTVSAHAPTSAASAHAPADDDTRVRIEGGFDGDDYNDIVRKWKNERSGITITNVRLSDDGTGYTDASHSGADYGGASYGNASHGGADYGNASHGGADYGNASHGGADYGNASHGGADYGNASHGGADYGNVSHSGADYGGASHGGGYAEATPAGTKKHDTLTVSVGQAAEHAAPARYTTQEHTLIKDDEPRPTHAAYVPYTRESELYPYEINPLESGEGDNSEASKNTQDFDNAKIKPTTQPLPLVGTITEEVTAASELKRARGEKRRRGSSGLIDSLVNRRVRPETAKFDRAARRRAGIIDVGGGTDSADEVQLNIDYDAQVVRTGEIPAVTFGGDTDAKRSAYKKPDSRKLANQILNGGVVPTSGIGFTDTLSGITGEISANDTQERDKYTTDSDFDGVSLAKDFADDFAANTAADHSAHVEAAYAAHARAAAPDKRGVDSDTDGFDYSAAGNTDELNSLADALVSENAASEAGIARSAVRRAKVKQSPATSAVSAGARQGASGTSRASHGTHQASHGTHNASNGAHQASHGTHRPKHDDDKAVQGTIEEMYREISIKTVVLSVITAILLAIEVYNTLVRPFLRIQIGIPWLSFVDKVINPTGYILMNIVFGVIASLLCRGVFMCLFRPNRGGERLTALVIIGAVAAALPAVVHFDLVQRGYAFIYIPAAVFLLLCDTLKKRRTILTMRQNFGLVYGDSAKFYGNLVSDGATARELAKQFENIHVPAVVTMRKTEYLTHFLSNGFSPDITDAHGNKHAAIAFVFAALAGVAAHLAPFVPEGLRNDLVYSASVFAAVFVAAMPVSLMFSVCDPLSRVASELSRRRAVVAGYSAAGDFSQTNVVALDASALFPPGSVSLKGVKVCRTHNGLNDTSVNESLIIAASLSVQSGSVMADMFYSILNFDGTLLRKIDELIYEENMGVTGWLSQRRVFFGNEQLMKRHEIAVPDVKALRRSKSGKRQNVEVVYLALGGDVVAAFGVDITANTEVADSLRRLQSSGISIAVRTGDSIVTAEQLAHMFSLDDEMIRVITFNAHERFKSAAKYTTTGGCGITCDGTLSSFACGVVAAKRLLRDIHRGSAFAYFASAVGIVVFAMCALMRPDTAFANSVGLIGFNTACYALLRLCSR